MNLHERERGCFGFVRLVHMNRGLSNMVGFNLLDPKNPSDWNSDHLLQASNPIIHDTRLPGVYPPVNIAMVYIDKW